MIICPWFYLQNAYIVTKRVYRKTDRLIEGPFWNFIRFSCGCLQLSFDLKLKRVKSFWMKFLYNSQYLRICELIFAQRYCCLSVIFWCWGLKFPCFTDKQLLQFSGSLLRSFAYRICCCFFPDGHTFLAKINTFLFLLRWETTNFHSK